MEKKALVPQQVKGKQVDLAEKREFDNTPKAEKMLNEAFNRLLHPQQWQELCGKASASFDVFAPDLQKPDREIREGDYLRIDIPGPGTGTGDGYDWVRVDMIRYNEPAHPRGLGIKLVPCANPEKKEKGTAHFFDEGSSSTILVVLNGTTIETTYSGRNEVINNTTGKVSDDLRNTVIGTGAKAGLSEAQWKTLIRSLLND